MAVKDKQAESGLLSYLWAGTEDGFNSYMAHQKAIEVRIAKASSEVLLLADAWDDEKDSEPEDTHWLLQKYGDVGVIHIKGTLVEGSCSFWSWRSEIGYDDLRNATVAAMNSGCRSVVNVYNTPGGMVRGLGACSDFLKYANSIVPIYSYTSTQCASGGVWLAVAPGRFYASREAEVGSIGVMQVTSENTKMMAEYGITQRVFKSAPLKGYGNPYEKLSAAAAGEIDRMVAAASDKFNTQVATGLGLDKNYVKQSLATGQIWFGDEAKDLQLVQKNISFDKLLVDLQKKVSQNKPTTQGGGFGLPTTINALAISTETDMKNKTLNPGLEDALAKAAVTLALANASAGEPGDPGEPADPNTPDPAEPNTPDPAEPNTPEAKAPASKTPDIAGLDKLAATISTLSDELILAKTELATVKAAHVSDRLALTTLQSTDTQYKTIAIEAIQWATVAMGGTPPDKDSLMTLASPLLIKQHTDTMAAMNKRFGEGGRKSTTEEEGGDEELDAAAAEFDRQAMLPLSRIGGNRK